MLHCCKLFRASHLVARARVVEVEAVVDGIEVTLAAVESGPVVFSNRRLLATLEDHVAIMKQLAVRRELRRAHVVGS